MANIPGGQADGPDNTGFGPGNAPPAAPPDAMPGRRVAERRKRFLVTPQPPADSLAPFGLSPFAMGTPGIQPLTLQTVDEALRSVKDIEVVGTVGARNLDTMGAGMGGGTGGGGGGGSLVARMTDERARDLQQQGQGRLLVERDQHLHLLDPVPRHPTLVNSFAAYDGPHFDVDLVVLGKDGMPLAGAEVSLFGGLLPAAGLTDDNGRLTLTVHGDSPHTVSGLYVKPRADYWSFYQRDPDLSREERNVVGLRALSDSPQLPDFPNRSTTCWGARAMRLDGLPPSFRGQGVKVAVIDSGAATSHADLARIRAGFDVIKDNYDTWTQDQLGHGSHCAGVIAGYDPGFGIRGFAPEAEIHVCKLFPGGQISQLVEALEYCIEHGIDVVNMSLGGTGPSPALEQQILRAKRAGVACIAAAGNSGGPVQYPAASQHVLAVAAIGKIDEFPRDSYHVETIYPDVDAQGYFTAKFSCFGPEVDVCAPGVAVVSSVPPNNFAAWDGTSMAAPHITGLAALMLAHRAEFQGQGRNRSAERVEQLFQLIRMSARRVSQAAPTRIGYGMPDALVALGLAPALGQQAFRSMLGSLMAMPGAGMTMAAPVPPSAARQPPGGMAPGGMAPFGFGFGGLRPQGW
jgi:subtilisin